MPNGSIRNINIENPQTAPKLASTVFTPGMWLQYDGSGHVQPLAATNKVVGLNITPINSASSDYATAGALLTYDGVDVSADRFLMPVTTGTAIASMIGSTFDVDSNSYGLNVSGSGTQFCVTKVINSTLVEVQVVLVA